jgi:DNA-binding NtrC family response regulator
MKILVVDDEGIVLSSCRRILESENFEVVEAGSVDEALKILESETGPFSLLLVDVKMPVHDGTYLMQKVREKDLDLKIIVMSGYATDETINRAEAFGAATFIAKPFTPEELLDTVLAVAGKGNRNE